jgi:uncharacterized protein (TIGR02271 family)
LKQEITIMENTVIAVYDNESQAQSAMKELLASGFSRSAVRLTSEQGPAAGGSVANTDQAKSESGIGHFFRTLFGMGDAAEDRHVYSEAVRRGSCVLVVDADAEEERDRASAIMVRYDPIDIDERASYWRSQGWSAFDDNAPRLTDDEVQQERSRYAQGQGATEYVPGTMNMQADRGATTASDMATGASATDQTQTRAGESARIPVVEEELKVGKREVQRGGVRVFQRVRETPVHEQVVLREEHVKVERHPVDQPADAADMTAFKEGSVEMREMAEEPVVEKTARVVEEVVVGKEVSQRTAEIDDTVRRTDVEIEQLGAGAPAMAGTPAVGLDDDFRRHWQTSYGQSGGRYEDYDSAYRYGSGLAGTQRFSNYRWDDVEPDMRRDWESNHPESAWEKVKDAVRYGVERVKGSARH